MARYTLTHTHPSPVVMLTNEFHTTPHQHPKATNQLFN